VFSPRIALAWQATPNLKWRAGIATGFRAPEIFVEDVHVDTLGGEQVRVRNTDGLKEERALTTLFGFDWRSDPANPVELGCHRLLCAHPRHLRTGRDPARR
jgi:outer membrane receptor for ferrienterochelin and colicins